MRLPLEMNFLWPNLPFFYFLLFFVHFYLDNSVFLSERGQKINIFWSIFKEFFKIFTWKFPFSCKILLHAHNATYFGFLSMSNSFLYTSLLKTKYGRFWACQSKFCLVLCSHFFFLVWPRTRQRKSLALGMGISWPKKSCVI